MNKHVLPQIHRNNAGPMNGQPTQCTDKDIHQQMGDSMKYYGEVALKDIQTKQKRAALRQYLCVEWETTTCLLQTR